MPTGWNPTGIVPTKSDGPNPLASARCRLKTAILALLASVTNANLLSRVIAISNPPFSGDPPLSDPSTAPRLPCVALLTSSTSAPAPRLATRRYRPPWVSASPREELPAGSLIRRTTVWPAPEFLITPTWDPIAIRSHCPSCVAAIPNGAPGTFFMAVCTAFSIGPAPTADEHLGAGSGVPPWLVTPAKACRAEYPPGPETVTAPAAWTPVMARVASPAAAAALNAGLMYLVIACLPGGLYRPR